MMIFLKFLAIALYLFNDDHYELCLYHSRHFAKTADAEPSRLCWADKLSILYEPWWLYLPRAWASLQGYRRLVDLVFHRMVTGQREPVRLEL